LSAYSAIATVTTPRSGTTTTTFSAAADTLATAAPAWPAPAGLAARGTTSVAQSLFGDDAEVVA
jgi:hypothetical protein